MPATGPLFRHLFRWVAGALTLAVLAGMLLPVYTDEVGWRLQERAALDGVDKLYSENCGPNTLAVPPWFMMPVRWYSAFFNTHFADPLWVRVSGVAYALLLGWLVWRLIGRVGRDEEQRHKLGIIAATLMGLGVMPLLLVWSRPEQPILLAVAGALVIAATGWRAPGIRFAPLAGVAYTEAPTAPRSAWRRSLAILALGVVAMSYHFKGVGVMPVMAGCILFASRGRRALAARGVTIALLLLASGISAKYWVARMDCPADPVVAAAHAKENLVGQLAVGQATPTAVLGKLIDNYRPHKYVDQVAPMPRPMSRWLVRDRVSNEEMHGWQGGMAAIWGLALGGAAIATLLMLWRAARERVMPPETVLALLLFGVASVWCVSQIIRHVYESSFVLPLVMLAIVLALSAPHGSHRMRQAVSVLALGIGPLTLLSMGLVASYYGPPLVEAASARGSLPLQPYSVPVFGFAGERVQMQALARQCGLPETRAAKGLMLDDISYFAFMESRLPDHQLAILSPRLRGSISDPIAYLRARGSSGVLTRCVDLPEALAARAHRKGAYCCLAPADWPASAPFPPDEADTH